MILLSSHDGLASFLAVSFLLLGLLVSAGPPDLSGPKVPRAELHAIRPQSVPVTVDGGTTELTLSGKYFTEEFGFGVLRCRFHFPGQNPLIVLAARSTGGCRVRHDQDYQFCASTQARCALPNMKSAARVAVQITNDFGLLNHTKTDGTAPFLYEGGEGRWSTEKVYFTFVPRLQRISVDQVPIGVSQNVSIFGQGLRAVGNKTMACVFVNLGIHNLFIPSTMTMFNRHRPWSFQESMKRNRTNPYFELSPVQWHSNEHISCVLPAGESYLARELFVTVSSDFCDVQCIYDEIEEDTAFPYAAFVPESKTIFWFHLTPEKQKTPFSLTFDALVPALLADGASHSSERLYERWRDLRIDSSLRTADQYGFTIQYYHAICVLVSGMVCAFLFISIMFQGHHNGFEARGYFDKFMDGMGWVTALILHTIGKMIFSKFSKKVSSTLCDLRSSMEEKDLNAELQNEIKRVCAAALQENWPGGELVSRIEQTVNDIVAASYEGARAKEKLSGVKLSDLSTAVLKAVEGDITQSKNEPGDTQTSAQQLIVPPDVLALMTLAGSKTNTNIDFPVEMLSSRERSKVRDGGRVD